MVEEILNQVGDLTPIFVLGVGLAFGLEHAFESDHVAAVSTQVSKRKLKTKTRIHLVKESISESSLLGALWGAGHTTTLVLIGLLASILTITISQQLFAGFEFAVGLMLIFLGVNTAINKKFLRFKHKHLHQHKDGTIRFEEHDHLNFDHKHGHKSYLIGLIHGLAGSGTLVALAASTLDNVGTVMSFILFFGIGSILGMVLVSGLMGLPLAFTHHGKWIQKLFRFSAGTISLILGANIIYNIGILGNLFGF